jgi:membrane protein implicated in regulation of membrane protease activity
MEMFQVSIIAGIVLLILEMFTITYIFLGMSIGSFVVAGVQFLFDGLSFNRDLMIFAVVSSVAIFLIRKIFMKRSDQNKIIEDDVNQY